MPLRTDTRGQAITIGRGLAGLFMAGVLWALTEPIFRKFETAGQTHLDNQTALTGQTYLGYMFNNFPVIIVGITVLGMIAMAVYQRRGGA